MAKDLTFVVKTIADTVLKNEAYFSELDGVVGDGDFGYSIARGFEKVLENWDSFDQSTPSGILKGVAMTITSAVGGVSGVIWGTAFLRSAIALGSKTEITKDDVIAMFKGAIEGIKKRGNCELGDKTYLDTLVPTVEVMEKAFAEGKSTIEVLELATAEAKEKAEATRGMIAKRGRAAYTGERSIGTLDAGSVATAVLFEAVTEAWKQE